MLKRISPQDLSDPPVPKPATAAPGTTSTQPEPSVVSPAQPEPDIATVPAEIDP